MPGSWARYPLIGTLGVWVASTVAGCGRIGYDPLGPGLDEAGRGDATVDASSGPDGSRDGSTAASAVPDVAGTEGAASDGPDASDATDERLDAPDAPACMANASASTDYCTTLPSLPEAPVIDGVVDCSLPLIAIVPVGWTGGAAASDATAQYAAAWRPDGVYFFVQVHDPTLVPADPTEPAWQGDAVEIYVDSDGVFAAPPAYDNPGTRQFVVSAPSSSQASVARGEIHYTGSTGTIAWTSTQFRAYATTDGYVVEAFVAGPDLGLSPLALAPGGRVGQDLSIDVSYPADRGPDAGGFGNRMGQYFLRVGAPDAGAGLPPFDVRAFCTPTLTL
jgi:hypothetical protein